MNTNEYIFPPVELLNTPETTDNDSGDLREELRSNADRLIKVLEEYGVSAAVKDIKHGPAVTRYEIAPAAGVRINKITNLSNDMAPRLAAESVRIEAPIPGKSAVGIEIPNRTRETVYLRELIESEPFRCAEGPLTVGLGRDVERNIFLADLAKMPHLIIAGSTGTGKSVCINSILISLIYKTSPENVRLILADPKGVELNNYEDIPHLLVPVLYGEEKGAGALLWAFVESCKRYDLLSNNNVSDIDEYNELAGKTEGMEKLPRIVMVIDEMVDILDVSPVKVQEAASRLAVKGRRVGIHLIISTQRPSVDVITGTIKNNVPAVSLSPSLRRSTRASSSTRAGQSSS